MLIHQNYGFGLLSFWWFLGIELSAGGHQGLTRKEYFQGKLRVNWVKTGLVGFLGMGKSSRSMRA